jgi:hypothetical protein
VVGESPTGSTRSSYRVIISRHFPFVNSIEDVRWFVSGDINDCQLYLKTRAAPRSSVQVDWSIYRRGLLLADTSRDHYEVEIATGTPLTTIRYASWLSAYPDDLRLQIGSEAESPFRWFKAEWRVYAKEGRYRKVIDEMMEQASLATAPLSREAITVVKIAVASPRLHSQLYPGLSQTVQVVPGDNADYLALFQYRHTLDSQFVHLLQQAGG